MWSVIVVGAWYPRSSAECVDAAAAAAAPSAARWVQMGDLLSDLFVGSAIGSSAIRR